MYCLYYRRSYMLDIELFCSIMFESMWEKHISFNYLFLNCLFVNQHVTEQVILTCYWPPKLNFYWFVIEAFKLNYIAQQQKYYRTLCFISSSSWHWKSCWYMDHAHQRSPFVKNNWKIEWRVLQHHYETFWKKNCIYVY